MSSTPAVTAVRYVLLVALGASLFGTRLAYGQDVQPLADIPTDTVHVAPPTDGILHGRL